MECIWLYFKASVDYDCLFWIVFNWSGVNRRTVCAEVCHFLEEKSLTINLNWNRTCGGDIQFYLILSLLNFDNRSTGELEVSSTEAYKQYSSKLFLWRLKFKKQMWLLNFALMVEKLLRNALTQLKLTSIHNISSRWPSSLHAIKPSDCWNNRWRLERRKWMRRNGIGRIPTNMELGGLLKVWRKCNIVNSERRI